MGLEAGDAFCAKRSCFKASSGDQPNLRTTSNHTLLYGPLVRRQAHFALFASTMLKNRTGELQIRKER